MKCGILLSSVYPRRVFGSCDKLKNHAGGHSNNRCTICGIVRTKRNTFLCRIVKRGSWCKKCTKDRRHKLHPEIRSINFQRLGKRHIFPCGCSVILPKEYKSNKDVVACTGGIKNYFRCRITNVLGVTIRTSEVKNYAGPKLMSHIILRKMMNQPCVFCGEFLDWIILGRGKTPCLDHDHESGKINGFAHPVCNSFGLRRVNKKLLSTIRALKEAV